jgi:hypothetical protein
MFSVPHIKHISTLCGQNVELLNVKPGGTYTIAHIPVVYIPLIFTGLNLSYTNPPVTVV